MSLGECMIVALQQADDLSRVYPAFTQEWPQDPKRDKSGLKKWMNEWMSTLNFP